MSEHVQINLSQSLKEILEAKLQFHTDQLLYHKQELKNTSQALLLFNQHKEEVITSFPERSATAPKEMFASSSPEPQKNDAERITQRAARPHVERFFKHHKGQYTTAEIFDLLKKELGWKDADRAKWISSISSTLNTLVAYEKVRSYETGVGRIKKYESGDVPLVNGKTPNESGALFESETTPNA